MNLATQPITFLRLPQIIGYPDKKINPVIPVSSPTWWNWVKSGKAPNMTAWRSSDIQALVNELSEGK